MVTARPRLLPGCLMCLAAVTLHCVAQETALPPGTAPLPEGAEEPDPEPDSEPTDAPPVWMAPNPPACAADWGNTFYVTVVMVQSIVRSTGLCAEHLGWEHSVDVMGHDHRNWPLGHSEIGCAANIINTVSKFSGAVSNIQSIMFACFDNNQACGQGITRAIRTVLDTAKFLIAADKVCQPENGNPPYFTNKDIPLRGLDCWTTLMHLIFLQMRTAKYIQVAVATCPEMPPEPEPALVPPEPEPVAEAAAEPAPVAGTAAAPEPAPEAPAGTTTAEPSLGAAAAGWDGLARPSTGFPGAVPGALSVAPSERRLLEEFEGWPRRLEEFEGTTLGEEGALATEELERRLADARAQLAPLLEAFGMGLAEEDADDADGADAEFATRTFEQFGFPRDRSPVLV